MPRMYGMYEAHIISFSCLAQGRDKMAINNHSSITPSQRWKVLMECLFYFYSDALVHEGPVPPILPITALAQQQRQLLQIFPVHFVESILNGAIYINDSHHLLLTIFLCQNWHYNLALAVAVTSNVTRKHVHIRNQLRLLRGSSSSADAFAELYGLTSNFALEWTQYELCFCR